MLVTVGIIGVKDTPSSVDLPKMKPPKGSLAQAQSSGPVPV